jgi:hypothetical protein
MNASKPCHARRIVLVLATAALLPWPFLCAQPPEKQLEKLPPPAPAAKLAIVLKDRHSHAAPERTGTTHTGAGGTDIAQPRDDLVVVTMTGVAVAGPHPCQQSVAAMRFDLDQCFEIVSSDKHRNRGRLTAEASIVGLLRGDKHGGSAAVTNGNAAVNVSGAAPPGATILDLAIDGHAVAGSDNQAINDRIGPRSVAILPGEYHLLQTFQISAAHARGICGTAASAEFAPDPALDPQWISITEPFRGVSKKDFGFRVTLRVETD